MPKSPFKGKAQSKGSSNMKSSSGKPQGLKSIKATANAKGWSGKPQGQKTMPITLRGGMRGKKVHSTAQPSGKKTLKSIKKSIRTTMGHY
jgi:hypothetical protein